MVGLTKARKHPCQISFHLLEKKKVLRNIYIFKKPKKETKLPKEIYKTKPEINK